jgi:hypothetical protein
MTRGRLNILIFPCGTEIGLEINRSICNDTHFNVYGASSIEDHGSFVFNNYIGGLPFVFEKNFINEINKVIKENEIDLIFPAHDEVLLKLSEEFEKGCLECPYIGPNYSICNTCRFKSKTYKVLEGSIATPKLFKSIIDVKKEELPVFVKPDNGQGSKGATMVTSLEELKIIGRDKLVMEYLPGREFTIDCFSNKDGILLFCEGRERIRVSNGISVRTASTEDVRFIEIARIINSRLRMRGVWFFQVKEDRHKNLVLLEVAPRVAGTMCLVRCKGVNLPLVALYDSMGINVEILENNYKILVDRSLHSSYKLDLYYEKVYIDLDDSVLLDGRVNLLLISFIYQCINEKIVLSLITKHKDELNETLKQHRLFSLFDEVIQINPEDEKFKYINSNKSIFIDDSFRERKKVKENVGIPVFDTHMIEALIKPFE